jgi:ribosomal protein S18 acetylase RimI-like enzyme
MERHKAGTASSGPGTLDRRPVADGDEDLLLKVFASTREEELAAVDWSDEQKEAFLRHQLVAQKTDYDSRFPDAQHDVLLLDGEPIGQIWIGRSDAEIRLLDIAILPEYRRRGVGTILLKELQEEASRAGKPLCHCVYKGNQPAFIFYERLGFVVTGDLGLYVQMEWNPTPGS